MKKYIYLFIILLSVVSCSDWLEEEPKSVAAETFYNTESEAAAAVAAPLANLKGYGGLDGSYRNPEGLNITDHTEILRD